ncbi:MAG: HAMP domain-containing protein [Sphingomonas sp.]|uniref:HAMP domain-containing sensor histidine kinase n=1 Tax=Sphingomonas sp. TaxID=28214 RepID=UPI001824D439|nr:HAMP domain-containing protein [Sphingomonas sp.]
MLVALALFVAQAINFAVIFEARRQTRLQAIVGPAAARIADAEDRIATGRFRQPIILRGRVQLQADDPIGETATRRSDVESALRRELTELGIGAGAITSATEAIAPDDPRLRLMSPRQAARLRRVGTELVLAVERGAGGGWLVQRLPLPRSDRALIATLIGQTIVLYVIVLLPMLWAARRISQPLQALTVAARQFRPGDAASPLDERGPPDVRAVIAAFNQLRLRVSAMLEEKDRMLGAIGHDLRTPLAALRVRIESVEDDEDRARMAETIAEMNRTLDDILSLARLGRPSEPMAAVDMAALVDAVVDDFVAIGTPVSFSGEGRVTLSVRPSLMRRAVRNLIENAVKYGGSADVRLEVTKEAVAIIVADQGPGIPPDKLDAVFDAFTRLETSRNRDTGGAGLGLALARAIVREAGGEISLANRAGGGLDATITLPRRG